LKPFSTLRALDVQLYRLGDDVSGALILPMLVFSPWAFGTTQPWAIWVMNWAGYALGSLLLLKLFIRNWKKYPAPRWDHFSARTGIFSRHRHRTTRLLTRVMAGLTLAVLGYILISALNVAANCDGETGVFHYHHYLAWLPHSFDGQRTWFHFWMYLGLAALFWSVADWLPGMTAAEERKVQATPKDIKVKVPMLPARLRTLLWVLCLNGAALGLEAIIQRACGSSKLLFLVQPSVNREGETQFGTYAYRSNAAQYFNLLWPLCLGFWWTLERAGGMWSKAHHWLLVCAAIMAACPVISTSRGGAMVSAGILVPTLIYIALTSLFGPDGRKRDGSFRWGTPVLLMLFLTATLTLAWYFGWDSLEPRMEQIGEGYQGREAMYEAARPMLKDFPLFGTGPGTFATVFQLYLFSTDTYWPEQLHNDWLETLITFGWLGTGLLLAALGCVALRWFAPGGVRGSRRLVVLAWLGLGGCLVHALFDFPFQIHSTLFLFLVICAILFGLSGEAGETSR
jgi:O-antigen ligase